MTDKLDGLLPCRQCQKGHAEYTQFSTGPGLYEHVTWHTYMCDRCGFTASSSHTDDGARYEWNTRAAPEPPVAALVDELARTWNAYSNAVETYNTRLRLVRAERERGNYSMNVDAENREISVTNSAFIKAAQDLARAALNHGKEGE